MRLRHRNWPSAEATMTTGQSISQLAASLLHENLDKDSFYVRLSSRNDQPLVAMQLEDMGCSIEEDAITGGFTACIPKEIRHQ